MIENIDANPPVGGILHDARLLAIAVFVGIAAAFVGGLLIGWASTGRPSTLSQAIQQANKGVLPSGAPSLSSTSTSSPAHPTAPAASLYNLAFFGIVSSVSGNQLSVETKAGSVGVQLTTNTRFATVDLAQSSRSELSSGKLVLIVPNSSNEGSGQSSVGTVILLPH